jgi:transcriptional regulator with XRE-family HTH domain
MNNNVSIMTLKSKMSAKGIRQADIAKAMDCSQGHISKILNGDIAPHSRLFQKVARFIVQDEECRSAEGDEILKRLIEECWDGTLEQALIFDDIIRSATKLSYLT